MDKTAASITLTWQVALCCLMSPMIPQDMWIHVNTLTLAFINLHVFSYCSAPLVVRLCSCFVLPQNGVLWMVLIRSLSYVITSNLNWLCQSYVPILGQTVQYGHKSPIWWKTQHGENRTWLDSKNSLLSHFWKPPGDIRVFGVQTRNLVKRIRKLSPNRVPDFTDFTQMSLGASLRNHSSQTPPKSLLKFSIHFKSTEFQAHQFAFLVMKCRFHLSNYSFPHFWPKCGLKSADITKTEQNMIGCDAHS